MTELETTSAYMLKGTGLALGQCEFPHAGNIKWLDKNNALADVVVEFRILDEGDKLDFVRMWDFIRQEENAVETLRKGMEILKPGGFLIIIENKEPDKTAKHFFNFVEMEGLLMFFDDYVHINFRGEEEKFYYYICRRKELLKKNEDKNGTEAVAGVPHTPESGTETQKA